MRKPKPARTADDASPPAGGRALGRARQFALSRGLPEPTPVVETVAKAGAAPTSPKKPATPAAKPRKPVDR